MTQQVIDQAWNEARKGDEAIRREDRDEAALHYMRALDLLDDVVDHEAKR